MVFDRVPWYRDSTWLLPLFYGSVGALALTALLWPIAAIVRRRYGATLALDSGALRVFRVSRTAAIVILAGLGLWAFTVGRMLTNLNYLGDKSDALIRVSQIVGCIAFIGGWAAMLGNLIQVWTGGRRWPAKCWSVVLLFAASVVLWIAIIGRLIGLGLDY
jgi:hypothetical protein